MNEINELFTTMKQRKSIAATLIVGLLVFSYIPSSQAQVSAVGDRLPDRDVPTITVPQVTGVEVKKIKVRQIKLGWKPVALTQQYEITVMQGDEVVKTVTSTTVNKTIKSLKSGTTYQFQVRAQVGNNYGEYSTVLTAQTKAKLSKNNNDIIDNELIIEVKKHKKLDTPYPYERLKISKYTKNNFIHLKINDNTPSDEVIETLEKLPGVISVEYNIIYTLDTTKPNDEYYSDNTWESTFGWQHLGYTEYGYGGQSNTATYDNEAWDDQTGSKNLIIAVIDSGIDTDHPDLQGNLWINEDEISGNGIDDDNNGYIDDIHGWDFGNNQADPNPNMDGVDNNGDTYVDETASHGTGVMGALAPVGNNTIGVVGPMWDASIMALQTNINGDGGMNGDAIVNAINYAITNGADIINMSFGSSTNSTSLSSAISAAASAGIFLVASAGNNPYQDLNTSPRYPVCYDKVFGVSGYSLDAQAAYETYGSNCVDLVAPYNRIKTTSVNTSDGSPSYVNTMGTSYSAPIVAGIAGLLLSRENSLTPTEITNILIATVTKKDSIPPQYGAGLVNAGAALAGVDCLNSDGTVKTVYTYYKDSDKDGYGTTDIEYSCSTPPSTGMSTNNTDCNDTDSTVASNKTYYQDADGDGLGNSSITTSICSSTVPSGYVTNSSDKNDDDYDNDGVSTGDDCNDKDSSISKNKTYYQDADGDGLGNSSVTKSVCSNIAPSGYVTNSSDKNDADYDNDGISNISGDCNDKDATIGYSTTYYKDADADGLGSSNTNIATKACSQPSGYVSNSNDKNDSDYDNDGTSTSNDCNDKDSTISTNKTYYQDADGDGLGSPTSFTSACSNTAPTGYVTNGNDTNDTVNSANVEAGDDTVDNDGDGTVDETNTTDENGYNPTYASNDPASTEQYAESVTEIAGATNGAIIVTFADNSEYTYTIFDISTDKKTKVKSFNSTGYLVVLHPQVNYLALVNVYTGQIYETQQLSDSNWSGKALKLKDLLDDGKTEAVVTATQDDQVLTVIVRVNPNKDDKLKKKDSLKLTSDLVETKKTNVKTNTIELRDENKVVLATIKVNDEYEMSIVE